MFRGNDSFKINTVFFILSHIFWNNHFLGFLNTPLSIQCSNYSMYVQLDCVNDLSHKVWRFCRSFACILLGKWTYRKLSNDIDFIAPNNISYVIWWRVICKYRLINICRFELWGYDPLIIHSYPGNINIAIVMLLHCAF